VRIDPLTVDQLSSRVQETRPESSVSGAPYLTVSRVSSPGIVERAARAMAETSRQNTLDAYAGDWRPWWAFCATEGLDPLSPSEAVLVVYAKWLADERSMAPESIRRRLTGVLAGWRGADVDYRRNVTKPAREWIADYEAKLIQARMPTGRGQAPFASADFLRAIAATQPDTAAGRRNMAVVLLGFSVGGRRSELSYLDVADIQPGDNGGLYVQVRRSKSGARRVPVIRGKRAETCPVRAWERWRDSAGLTDGAALRRVDRHGNVGGRLSPAGVGAVVTRAAELADLELRLTGHSLRSGFATEARRAGHSVEQIADQGGWSRTSAALHRYIRRVDEWSNNPLEGIGL
jgi:integrase